MLFDWSFAAHEGASQIPTLPCFTFFKFKKYSLIIELAEIILNIISLSLLLVSVCTGSYSQRK